MTAADFTFTLETENSPEQVFRVIRDVRSWWSGLYAEEFTGETENLHDEFSFRAGEGAHYSKQSNQETAQCMAGYRSREPAALAPGSSIL